MITILTVAGTVFVLVALVGLICLLTNMSVVDYGPDEDSERAAGLSLVVLIVFGVLAVAALTAAAVIGGAP